MSCIRPSCRAAAVFVSLTLSVLGIGCSGETDGLRLVPAAGLVTYKGQPVAGALVSFSNKTANIAAFSRTGPDGRFEMTTRKAADGAVPGAQLVSVHKVENYVKGKPGVPYDPLNPDGGLPESKWVVPEKFSRFETSGLKVEIPEGGTKELVIELKD